MKPYRTQSAVGRLPVELLSYILEEVISSTQEPSGVHTVRLEWHNTEQASQLVRLSIVSRGFGHAVQTLIRSRPGVLHGCGLDLRSPVAFNSKLMLSWAPCATSLVVDLHATIGLHEFAALSQLRCLEIAAWDKVDSTHVDAVLHKCDHLLQLSYTGWVIPTVFPASLQSLQLDMDRMGGFYPWYPHASPAPESARLPLTKLPVLQHLTLILGNQVLLPSVRARHLPDCLQRLTVHISLGDPFRTLLNLGTLAAQPCKELWVHVSIGPSRGSPDVACLVRGLKGLRMDCLHLKILGEMGSLTDYDWRSVKAHRVVITLERHAQPCKYPPSGAELHIKLQRRFDHNTQISWQALLGAGHCVVIEKEACHGLQLCSSNAWDISRAQRLKTPWQLSISSASLLHGFPPSQSSKQGAFFWQNEAAAVAGWQQADEWIAS